MDNTAFQIFFLIAGLGLWYWSAFPTLRGMVDITEGRIRWQFVLWFSVLIASIFIIKFSLYGLTRWPTPGTWTSRLFFGFMLLLAYALPFVREMVIRKFRS